MHKSTAPALELLDVLISVRVATRLICYALERVSCKARVAVNRRTGETMRASQKILSRFTALLLPTALAMVSSCAGDDPSRWNTHDRNDGSDALTTEASAYQAEDAALSHAALEHDHAGYKGSAYVNYDNVTGGQITWTVNASSAGSYAAVLRFANGTDQNRTMRIEVNGATAQAALSFPATGAWTGWAEQTLEVTLRAGSNTIRAVATTSNGGPNVDQLELTQLDSGGAFRHPGVLVTRDQLDFVKAKVAAGAEPWKSALKKARDDEHGSLSYTPHPRATVECGSSSNPNHGCTDERNDAMAAYTHALLWYYTGDRAHANKSIAIMNAWAGTIQEHTNHNAPLQTGWSASMWAPAAEIIRHTGAGWSNADFDRFKKMLRDVYRPMLINGSCANGNWELIMTNGLLGIAVVLDDEEAFDKALTLWRGRVPAYMYMSADGDSPKKPGHCNKPSWYGQTKFVDGVGQETCRDFGHMEWGITASIDAAETALHQGVDLYAEQSARLRAALEFHANYDLGASVPSWLCGGSVSTATTPAWEISYNHFVGRMGFALPNTKRMVDRVRPSGNNYFIAWETLTHAETGANGF
jgi:hypothetical protein